MCRTVLWVYIEKESRIPLSMPYHNILKTFFLFWHWWPLFLFLSKMHQSYLFIWINVHIFSLVSLFQCRGILAWCASKLSGNFDSAIRHHMTAEKSPLPHLTSLDLILSVPHFLSFLCRSKAFSFCPFVCFSSPRNLNSVYLPSILLQIFVWITFFHGEQRMVLVCHAMNLNSNQDWKLCKSNPSFLKPRLMSTWHTRTMHLAHI